MKNLLLLAAFTLIAQFSIAQKPEPAIGKAIYDFVHLRDTTKLDKPYKEAMVLLVGRDASVYKSLTKQLQTEAMINDVRDQIKKAPDPNHVALTITGGRIVSDEDIYQYRSEKKLYMEFNVINYYLVEDLLPVINWKITADTLSFGTLHCQKATAHFRGRDYEAWFCPELPFHSGPWKLNGLPGLILQARDSKGEVQFNFAGFEDISKQSLTIAPPADDIRATLADIERLKAARKADPAGFARAAHGSGQAKRTSSGLDMVDPSKIQSIDVHKSSDGYSAVINNPIELPEKK